MKLSWTASNGNIVESRIYLSISPGLDWYFDKVQRRTWIQVWRLVFTTVPR